MLKRLTIDNFALINHIDVAFDDGLSIITGETGAGKSIIIGALSLLLGSRADSKSVKDRNEKMVVEAVFDIGDYDFVDERPASARWQKFPPHNPAC